MKRRAFKPNELVKISAAEDFQHPSEAALRLGDIVQLNSGGPKMMVVDAADEAIILGAWRDGEGTAQEAEFPRACVHRVSPV